MKAIAAVLISALIIFVCFSLIIYCTHYFPNVPAIEPRCMMVIDKSYALLTWLLAGIGIGGAGAGIGAAAKHFFNK